MVGLFLFIILLLFIILVFCTSIKVNIVDLKIDSIREERLLDLDVIIGLYLFNKIPYFKRRINKEKLLNAKLDFNKIIKKMPNNRFNFNKSSLKILNRIRIYIEKFNLESYIGIEDILLTIFVIPLISTIIPIVFNTDIINVDYNKLYYEINPIYNTNKFRVKFKFNGIFSIKVVNIIFVLSLILKKEI